MNLDAFNESFDIDDSPHWKCSTCKKGAVILNKSDIEISETVTSINDRIDYVSDWDKSWIKEYFVGTMTCSNQKCREKYSIVGLVNYSIDYSVNEEPEQYHQAFYPQFIYPCIHLFDIPDEVSSDVVESIENSFKLYWIDSSACGNAVRKVIEILLTDKSIRKTKTLNNGRRKRLTLHERIELFNMKYPEMANYIMAIKWIGNIASHDDELDKNELLEGFELLELFINKLYSTHEKDLSKRAIEINNKKRL